MAANASESNSITSRNEPHFASALARGKAISLLRLIISGNRETTPIYWSGYLSFIAEFAFLFRLTKIY